MKRFRRLLRIGFIILLALIIVVYLCDRTVAKTAKGKLYNDAQTVPFNKVGLLLGTAKYLADGRLNYYYRYRIDAAETLFKAGKVHYIVISGDNGRKEYNEPEAMRDDLIKRGVDSGRIVLDYAGFRTFDSMVRLKEIFGQTAATVISQPFHNERAVYIAAKQGINAIGFNARDVGAGAGAKVQLREKLARVKVFLDGLFGAKPKFLGEKIQLP